MVQKHSRSQRNIPYRHFAGYSLLILSLHTLAVIGFLITDYLQNKSLLKSNESLHVGLLEKSIARDFKSIPYDVESMLAKASLRGFIDDENPAQRARLQQDFKDFLLQRRIYSTIRYLDLQGNEQVRVDQIDRSPRLIPESEHLNHRSQDFFKQVSSMAAGNLYVSPIHLREENGVVLNPHQPVIRIATPLTGKNGHNKGILIVDYEAERLLTHFSDMLAGSSGDVSLLNRDGYWLHSKQTEREWGFMFGNQQRFGQYFTWAWNQISRTDNGQFDAEKGLFTYATVYPLGLLSRHLHGNNEVCAIHNYLGHDSYQWKIVSRLDSGQLMVTVWDRLNGITGLWWIIGSILSLYLGWYIARWHGERRELNGMLRLNAEVFKATTNGVMITDPAGRIVSVNTAFTGITGFSGDDVLGHNPSVLSSGKNSAAIYRDMWESIRATGAWEGEIWNRKKNGEIFPEWLHISVIKNDEANIAGYVGIFSDITQQKLTEQQLYQRAHHDPLTGLANRLLLDDRLRRAIAQGHRSHKKIALLYLDLDRFKPINDKYGHHVGDVVLCEVASRLEDSVRDVDTVARVGGDEFMILLPEEDSRTDAVIVAERVHAALNKAIEHQNLQLHIGVSIGIAMCPEDADDPEMLIAKADSSMYRTKLATRNTYTDTPL